MPNIIISKNPLDYSLGEFTDYIYDPTEHLTVAEYLKKHSIDIDDCTHPRICVLNSIDSPLLRKEYGLVYPKASDTIIILPLMQGGGSNPLKLLLGLALIAFAAPIAGFLSTTVVSSLGITTAIVARFGTALLLNGLVGKPKLKLPSNSYPEAASTYSLTAQGNLARPNSPIPSIYGRMNIFPDYVAQPFVTYFKDTNKQHLVQVFMVGHGQYEIESLKISDTPIGNFPEVNWAQLYFDKAGNITTVKSYKTITGLGTSSFDSTWDMTHLNYISSVEVSGQTIYGSNEPEYSKLTSGWVGGFVVNKSGTTISEIQIDLQCPQGLGYINNSAGIDARSVSWEVQAKKIDDNGDPITDWQNIAFGRTVTGSDTRTLQSVQPDKTTGQKTSYGIKYADKTSTVAINLGHRGTTEHKIITGAKNVSFTITAGNATYNTNDVLNLTFTSYSTTEYVRTENPDGIPITQLTTVWRSGATIQFKFSEVLATVIGTKSAASRTPLSWTLSYPVPVGRYEVRVRRTNTKGSLTDTRVLDEFRWVGLKGVLTKNPQLQDVTLIYVRIVATDIISGQASQKINAVVRRKLPILADGVWGSPTLTDYQNPMWAIADMIRASYGGDYKDTVLDLAEIESLAYYTKSRGDTFNYCFSEKISLFEAITIASQTIRITCINRWNKFRFVRDEPKSLVKAVFTPSNIKKGTLSVDYILPSPTDYQQIRAEFFNEIGWKWDTIEISNSKINPELPFLEVRFEGITNKAQVIREAKYRLNIARYRRKIVSFETSTEGFIPNYLDQIRITHPIVSWSSHGQIVSITPYSTTHYDILLDRDITYEASLYHLGTQTGGLATGDVITGTKSGTRTIRVTKAEYTKLFPTPSKILYVGSPNPTVLMMGHKGYFAETFIVTDRIPRNNQTVKLIGFVDNILNRDSHNAGIAGNGAVSGEFPAGGTDTFVVPAGVTSMSIIMSGGSETVNGASVYASYDSKNNVSCAYYPAISTAGTSPTGVAITRAGVTKTYEVFPSSSNVLPTTTSKTVTVTAGDSVQWYVYKAPTPIKGTVDTACAGKLAPTVGEIGYDGVLLLEFT